MKKLARYNQCDAGLGIPMATDDLERRVQEFVHELVPWLPLDMSPDTDVVDDAKICGDDVFELVQDFE